MAKAKAKKEATKGRPTKYKASLHVPLAEAYGQLGMTDKEICKKLKIAESTLNLWKQKYPVFSESLNKGKKHKDDEVTNALLQRALGYSHAEDKIFNNNGEALIVKTTKHYPPDPTSMIFWLKNRRPKEWKDKQEVKLDAEIKDERIDYSKLTDEELKTLRKIADKARNSTT